MLQEIRENKITILICSGVASAIIFYVAFRALNIETRNTIAGFIGLFISESLILTGLFLYSNKIKYKKWLSLLIKVLVVIGMCISIATYIAVLTGCENSYFEFRSLF